MTCNVNLEDIWTYITLLKLLRKKFKNSWSIADAIESRGFRSADERMKNDTHIRENRLDWLGTKYMITIYEVNIYCTWWSWILILTFISFSLFLAVFLSFSPFSHSFHSLSLSLNWIFSFLYQNSQMDIFHTTLKLPISHLFRMSLTTLLLAFLRSGRADSEPSWKGDEQWIGTIQKRTESLTVLKFSIAEYCFFRNWFVVCEPRLFL